MTISIKRFIEKKTKGRNIYWQGFRTEDALVFRDVMNLKGSISFDYFDEIESIGKTFQIFSIEFNEKRRIDWNSFCPTTEHRNFFERTIRKLSEESQLALVPYSSTELLEKEDSDDIIIFSIEEKLKKILENKFLLRSELVKNGINIIPTIFSRFEDLSFNYLLEKFGPKSVIQLSHGFSGTTTYFVDTEEKFSALAKKNPSEIVAFSPYVKGIPININAAIVGNRVFVASPSIQLIGIKGCIDLPFGYCGNDYYAASEVLTKRQMDLILDVIKRIGGYLTKYKYQGIFGIDLICQGGEVFFSELNPRFQNSTALLTQLQLINDINPFVKLHLLSFLTEDAEYPDIKNKELEEYEKDYYFPLKGSQIILYNLNRRDAKLKRCISSGTFVVQGDDLVRINDEVSFSKSNECKETFIVDYGIPPVGFTIEPNAPILRIKTLSQVLENDSFTLNENFKCVVDKIREKIILE
jgi:predicted ATP-grasp superfamily ATP-dependent carboligase